MNLAMVRLYCGDSDSFGYYNMQEVGLAKALEKKGLNVFIIILRPDLKSVKEKNITSKVKLLYVPARNVFNHGVFNLGILLKYNIDIVHLQSDNQLFAPSVMKFCKQNNIILYNYIGTIHSNSNSLLKVRLSSIFTYRNIKRFRNSINFVKTPALKEQLKVRGVNSELIPVGLDRDIIPRVNDSKKELRCKLGIPTKKKVILFVGKLEKYKNPFEAIELIKRLSDHYILLIIGKGSLKNDLYSEVKTNNLEKKVIFIGSVINSDIHEYYKLSDFFVNFNNKEIFGMSILEAMYQECVVIAKEAPGPNYIIENKKSGFLVNSLEDAQQCIEKFSINNSINPRNRIISNFNWEISADRLYEFIKNKY